MQMDLSRAACSNNGILYATDPTCLCFDCFHGPTCAETIPLSQCTINAEGGTPLLYGVYSIIAHGNRCGTSACQPCTCFFS